MKVSIYYLHRLEHSNHMYNVMIFPIACDPACVRGTCTEDMVCACPEGWIGEDCNTPSKWTVMIDHIS